MQDRIQTIRDRCQELIQRGNQLYRTTLPNVDVLFDLRGATAGFAQVTRLGQYRMRFNVEMIGRDNWQDHILSDTVPHELAHLYCFWLRLDRGHGANWRRVCMQLGGTGRRCHREAVVYAKGNTYVYTATDGTQRNVSQTIHRRIQAGSQYTLRNGAKLNRNCAWHLYGESASATKPAITAPVNLTPKPVIAAPAINARASLSGTKADQVRYYIRQAKGNGQGHEYAISMAIAHLGMARALAKTYVNNNWNKA